MHGRLHFLTDGNKVGLTKSEKADRISSFNSDDAFYARQDDADFVV